MNSPKARSIERWLQNINRIRTTATPWLAWRFMRGTNLECRASQGMRVPACSAPAVGTSSAGGSQSMGNLVTRGLSARMLRVSLWRTPPVGRLTSRLESFWYKLLIRE